MQNKPLRAPCRCLLAESMPDMAILIDDYLKALPAEVLADDETRRARLDTCLACESLADGTCILCGCYVEARTAKKKAHCPAIPPKWLALPEERNG